MSNSYPDAPTLEDSNALYPNGYSENTGLLVWTWNELNSEWEFADRPDKDPNYG